MKEGIILGTGNSRYLKSAITESTTWEEFRAALIAGTLPVDLAGINKAGWQQIGDLMGKKVLLEDDTAALYGLDATAVPDEVLVAARSLISTAQSTADSKCKIVSGSYTGTGTYGSGNKNSLTFDGTPKLLIVSSTVTSAYGGRHTYPQLIFVYGESGDIASLITSGSEVFSSATVSGSGNTVSWYSADAAAQQLNVSGTKYNYIAII